MLKWFSVQGIVSEIKKIRWPKVNELFDTFFKVCIFVILFMAFFFLSDVVVGLFLRLLGI